MNVWRVQPQSVTSLLHRTTIPTSQALTTRGWLPHSQFPCIHYRPQYCREHGRYYSTGSSQVSSEKRHRSSSLKPLNEGAIERIQKEFVLDEDINGKWMQVKDPETGKLRTPQTLISLLSTIDREKEVVRQLNAMPNAPVIVEITTRDALNAKLQAKEAAQAAVAKSVRESKPKQIELNWAISGHDLDMKLKQLRDFLEKGKKVEVLLAAKRKQRRATSEEAQNVIKQIRQTISEIDKCKEIAPMDGAIGGQALMTIQKIKK